MKKKNIIKKSSRSSKKGPTIALTLSGGGSRAIAFHLGCMKKLHELGILKDVDVISTVSGGSVIGAMYVYGDGSFKDFEKKIKNLLKKGLVKSIAGSFFLKLIFIPGTMLRLLGVPLSTILYFFDKPFCIRRMASRTTAFINAMNSKYFDGKKMTDHPGNKPNIVINGAELRTGSAFRFGNEMTYNWIWGEVVGNDILVAEAVVCSAAYPPLLPTLDRVYTFKRKVDGKKKIVKNRVQITDGGIYDNLGITAVDPDKDPKYSKLVYKPDIIIACNASYGMFDGDAVTYSFIPRITQSFLTLMKRSSDAIMKNLFYWKMSGKISDFVLIYLGKNDGKILKDLRRNKLPKGLPPRNQVDYPTNFSPMDEKDMDRLIRRGYILTEVYVKKFLSELIE